MTAIAKMAHPNVLNKFINGASTARRCLSPELIPFLDLWNKNFTSVFKGRETADFMIHFLPSLIKHLKEKGEDGNLSKKAKKDIENSMIGFKDLIHNFLYNQLTPYYSGTKNYIKNPTRQDPMVRDALNLLFDPTIEDGNLLSKLAIHCNKKEYLVLQDAMIIFEKTTPVENKIIKEKRQLEIEALRESIDAFKKNQKRVHQVEANAGPEFTFLENKRAYISNGQPQKKREEKAFTKNHSEMYDRIKDPVAPRTDFLKNLSQGDGENKEFMETGPHIDIVKKSGNRSPSLYDDLRSPRSAKIPSLD